jgi:hypothetical protein
LIVMNGASYPSVLGNYATNPNLFPFPLVIRRDNSLLCADHIERLKEVPREEANRKSDANVGRPSLGVGITLLVHSAS